MFHCKKCFSFSFLLFFTAVSCSPHGGAVVMVLELLCLHVTSIVPMIKSLLKMSWVGIYYNLSEWVIGSCFKNKIYLAFSCSYVFPPFWSCVIPGVFTGQYWVLRDFFVPFILIIFSLDTVHEFLLQNASVCVCGIVWEQNEGSLQAFCGLKFMIIPVSRLLARLHEILQALCKMSFIFLQLWGVWVNTHTTLVLMLDSGNKWNE